MKRHFFYSVIFSLFTISAVFSVAAPDNLLRGRMNTPLLKAEGAMTGEGVCWHAAYDAGEFLEGYRETHDVEYLDAAAKYFDALIAKLHESSDGYKGWVGPYIYDKNFIGDVHIGDAILINPMLEFSETVLKNSDAAVVQKYQSKANEYLHLAKKHLIEKWDARGTWREDGPYGVYVSWDQFMTPDNLTEWRNLNVDKSTLTLPFNKQNSMGIACLRIYRITGDEAYREKALKIFNYMKSRMCLFEDHYVWNYWEPFGEWDIEELKWSKLRHWVNVHPYRNYQSGEIHEIAEAYHSGLTFTQEDIQRIINTNLKIMWNGDKENPQWRNSNYAVQMAALGDIPIKKAPGGHFENLAGALWTGLFDFDAAVRELAGAKISTPPSFERKHADLPVTELQRPFHSNQYFIMAAAMPAVVADGQTTNITCQIRVAGKVKIELRSSDGKKVVQSLREAPEKNDGAAALIFPWKISDVAAGDYRIRWTMNGDYREFPVTVQ
ncbi:MAG: hypothetical protein P9L94_13870 [Candidatus Hinthialibacter antarcticus]|nr:hypothetical protein [Candidatus Hinthialibacter antarcticus]